MLSRKKDADASEEPAKISNFYLDVLYFIIFLAKLANLVKHEISTSRLSREKLLFLVNKISRFFLDKKIQSVNFELN